MICLDVDLWRMAASENGAVWLRKELASLDVVMLRSLAKAAGMQQVSQEQNILVEDIVRVLLPEARDVKKKTMFLFGIFAVIRFPL